MSNVSIERMCTFLMLTGTTFNYFLLIKKLRNLNLVQNQFDAYFIHILEIVFEYYQYWL